MFVLVILLALQGAFIGGHMVKSDVHHGIQSEIVVKSAKFDEDATASGGGSVANQDFLRSIAFYPGSVDFGAWSVGTARSYLVTLINKNANKSVHLSSISGTTQEFYSSFFEDKVVPPQGNTTFNVVFLPRSFGIVETDLFIHTSFGQAKLPVKGEGRECPYRIKSLVGIKAPFNATIMPEIHMYNPHSTPIQILEVYSSGGQFQLELPSGGQEGPQALWEIPPRTTKPIIRIRFHGTSPGNHTAFIRVKISEMQETNEDNVLVIPVEIEITEDTGLYLPNPILDFGKVASYDDQKEIKLKLVNSGQHAFQGLEYRVKNVSGLVELRKFDLTLRLNAQLALKNINLNGALVIKTWRFAPTNENRNGKKFIELSVGLRAEIYRGSLDFQRNLTVFITGAKNYTRDERPFQVENKFTVPIAILNITIENNDTKTFRLSGFEPRIIAPGDTIELFRISAINESANFITNMKMHTNLSTYEFPIVVCTGLLERYSSIDPVNLTHLPEDNVLEFGVVPYGDYSHFGYIVMRNPNPVPIQLHKWNFTNPRGVYYQSMFLGCTLRPEIAPDNHRIPIQQRFSLCLNVTNREVAAFQLAVQSFSVKPFTGVFQIWTEIEEIETTVQFVVVMGRLEVDQTRLHFTDCFPGKRCSADISIHSTFVKTMRVNSITVSVPGLIFEYHTQNGLPEITANSITDIGHIHFDPKSVCAKRCYIPQEGDIEPKKWRETLDFDEPELRRRTELFRDLKFSLQMITFTLNTSEVRLFEFNSTVDIVWPKLVNGHQILKTIEVGQEYEHGITITNPSNRDIRVELSIADPDRAKTTSLSLPLEVVSTCLLKECFLTDQDVFVLGSRNDERVVLDIQANSEVVVPIKFTGKLSGTFTTLLHIRNNLTVYEVVWVTGKAVEPQFRFGNRRPGSPTPLLFEITEKHLTSCDRSSSDDKLLVSTKRTFTARNTGEIAITVERFLIGDRECEGYGFKILDCSSFELQRANSSKKIDVAFTPDFTMTRISRQLVIETNLSTSVKYTLLATVPASSLEVCAKSIPRPFWEGHMKKMSVGVLTVAFMFVLITAFLDSDKVLKDHVQNMSKDKGPMQPPLDLRNIGMKQAQPDENQCSNGIGNNNGGSGSNQEKSKTMTPNIVKKRNVKRNNIVPMPPTVQNNSKDRSWADELGKKFNTSASMSPPVFNPIPPTKATQTTPPVVVVPKPVKEEKTVQPKKTAKEPTESEKNLPDKSINLEIEKKCEPKIESSPPSAPLQQTEQKRRIFYKKSKPVPVEPLPKEIEPPVVCAVQEKPVEKPPRTITNKAALKEKTDSHQPVSEKKPTIPPSEQTTPPAPHRTSSISPTNNIDAPVVTPRNNPSQRKYGKTPGRERKKEQSATPSSKRSERKVPKFKGTAFQFPSLLSNSSSSVSLPPVSADTKATNSNIGTVTSGTNIWETNQAASFSNIVAQKSINPVQLLSNGVPKQEPAVEPEPQDTNNNNEHDWNEADLKNDETFGPDAELPKRSSVDLGPIGTRKSPSSTPVWESFSTNIHRPTPHISQQQSSNSSFFSSNFPIGANLEYTNNNQYLGGASGLLEHVFSESQHTEHNQSSDLLLSWLQRERVRQQTDWTCNRTWTPMGYQDDPVPAPATLSDQINVWQNSGAVRPPPGLSLPANRISPIPQQQMQPQQILPPQQLQRSQQPAPQSPNLDLNNHRVDPIQPYDPYASFSSIWSDSWNKIDKK